MIFTGILTAAGYSSRMGALKALLPWKGMTLVRYQVTILKQGGCDEIVLVTGHRSEDIRAELFDLEVSFVENSDYQSGRVSSVKEGIKSASSDTNAFVLLAVDQPRTPDIINSLINSHATSDPIVTSPRFNSKGGHPVVFSSSIKTEILSISEETEGLRSVFEKYRDEMNEVHFEDPIVRLDLNTYEDYEKARVTYGS